MNISSLISQYKGARSSLFHVSRNQSYILDLLAEKIGHVPATSSGYDIHLAAKQAWPNVAPNSCLLYTSPSPRDRTRSRMPSSA